MNIKSKQFNGKMHSTMEIACYSTHTVDLKNKDNTLTRELKKKSNQNPKNQQEKKSFKKTTISPS